MTVYLNAEEMGVLEDVARKYRVDTKRALKLILTKKFSEFKAVS